MASIAALPILIGLAVDYAIQFQARFDEASAAALAAPRRREPPPSQRPTIATACLATAAGFLALQLSPMPMVRGFGLLLIVGVAIAFALALTAGFAALSLRRGRVAGRRGRVAAGDLAGCSARQDAAALDRTRPLQRLRRVCDRPTRPGPRRRRWRWPSSAGALGTQIETVSPTSASSPRRTSARSRT